MNPNLLTLELAVVALQPVIDQLVLVGGCAVGLLITDNARPPVRETIDVDLVTEISPLSKYYDFGDTLKQLGFRESQDVICRWTKGSLVVDVMPTGGYLGFTNTWYDLAVTTAVEALLPNGQTVRHITAPLLIATKIESFYGRGAGDFLHHDIEDIINLVDGRPEVVEEVLSAPGQVRIYLEEEVDTLLAQVTFIEALRMHLRPSDQDRVGLVIERLRRIAGV
ncbi:MAG TPA: hypothetical protein VGK09_05120 [Rhodocyclaceae bacterium]|jgi:hypothetical protein